MLILRSGKKLTTKINNHHYNNNELVEVKITLNAPYLYSRENYQRYDDEITLTSAPGRTKEEYINSVKAGQEITWHLSQKKHLRFCVPRYSFSIGAPSRRHFFLVYTSQ
jgi:hypothetical protein